MYRIRNLLNSPRDYPLINGESIYLGSKGTIDIDETLVSPVLVQAAKKQLIEVMDIDTGTSVDIVAEETIVPSSNTRIDKIEEILSKFGMTPEEDDCDIDEVFDAIFKH